MKAEAEAPPSLARGSRLVPNYGGQGVAEAEAPPSLAPIS